MHPATTKQSLEKPVNKSFLLPIWRIQRECPMYFLFVALRIIMTCLPQRGYIHPDEYFQSVEVIAGDIFDVDFIQPWEFNKTFPIRSIVIPYITVGYPYKFLQMADAFFISNFNVSLKTPYFLTVVPRMTMCLLSLIVDFCVYKICLITNDYSYTYKLMMLSSSYVMLVFGTRTFSNTTEMILLSILLWLVADSQVHSNKVIKQKEYLSDKYENAKAAVDRARLYKLKSTLPQHSMRHCIAVSVVTVAGIFNRPTFILFALLPMFFWFHRGIGWKSVHFRDFHCRMIVFLLCSTLTIATFIIVDSFYFGYITMAEIQHFDITMEKFIVTPLNFIRYNMDIKKLAQHGLHPRFLHILINVPLLYGVLGFVAISSITKLFYRLIMGHYTSLPRIHSVQGLMTAAIVAPVAGLSYFPHQEPRFLIPILLPIIMLYSNTIMHRNAILKLWFSINIVCVIFYGFIHQGGLYSASVHISQQIKPSAILPTPVPVHLVTSHVYNLPLSFLQQRNTGKVRGVGSSKYRLAKTLFLQEMGSESLEVVFRRLSAILQVSHKPNIVYLLVPTSKQHQLDMLSFQGDYNLTVTQRNVFYPHISTEAFPDFFSLMMHPPTFSVHSFISSVFSCCGLGLYEINNKF